MKILITGSTGLLGQALSRQLARSAEVTGLSRHAPACPAGRPAEGPGPMRHVVCDLRDARQTASAIRDASPDVVIHTQALTSVDRCEQDPPFAKTMNVTTTANLIEALAPTDAWLLYVSTDYAFDGRKGAAYDEEDEPRPLNVYGRTKLAGERLALSRPRGLVVRVSTLFGPGRVNFCDEIVARLRGGDVVEAFTDQTTSPSYTADVAEAFASLVQALGKATLPSRILHVANTNSCTRLLFAQRVADLLGLPRERVRAIRMADQQRPAPRPACSALRSRHLPRIIGRTLRPWEDALHAYLQRAVLIVR